MEIRECSFFKKTPFIFVSNVCFLTQNGVRHLAHNIIDIVAKQRRSSQQHLIVSQWIHKVFKRAVSILWRNVWFTAFEVQRLAHYCALFPYFLLLLCYWINKKICLILSTHTHTSTHPPITLTHLYLVLIFKLIWKWLHDLSPSRWWQNMQASLHGNKTCCKRCFSWTSTNYVGVTNTSFI